MDKYTYRLELLKSYGFVEKLGCITNGKYAFLYHQLDLSELTDEQFMEFINIVKSELEES